MEHNSGDICRAQVVYYLSKNGKTEPPHMIEVPHLANEGLRLIDVKRKLTVLRGSAMANMFSWSYKRNYKNKYIWLDLSDEDAIVPGRGGEYVLKGSEFFDDCQDKMMKHVTSQESDTRNHPEVLQNKFRGAETWLKQDPPKSSSDQNMPSSLKQDISEKCTGLSQTKINSVRTGSNKKLFPANGNNPQGALLSRQGKHSSSPDDFLVDNKISSSSDLSDSSSQKVNDIKVLKVKSTVMVPAARHGCDASTQTDIDDSNYHGAPAKKENGDSRIPKPCKVLSSEHGQEQQPHNAEASLLSMISGESTSDHKTSSKKKQSKPDHHDKDSSSAVARLKHTTASKVLLQILSCGGLDSRVPKTDSDAEVSDANLEQRNTREQIGGSLHAQNPQASRVGIKPMTPRGHRSPESFDSRIGTPITYSCELELDNVNNHERCGHTIPQNSGIEEVLTALPSPSHEAEFSKLVSRCSSFSSRRSSRSNDFDIQQDKKIKEIGTAFGTPCKTPGGSPTPSGFYKSANASRVVSPVRLGSFEGARESWACDLSQRFYSARMVGSIFNTTEHFQIPAESKWKDLSPIKRDARLGKVDEKC